MSHLPRSGATPSVLATLLLVLAPAHGAHAQTAAADRAVARPETRTMMHARGTFEVKLTPEASDTAAEGAPLGRLALDKRFHGELEAASHGTMLTAGDPATGSAGYVAVERVSGTLLGHRGTFALQHSGTITQGTQDLTITVVPGSGTGELVGLAGTLTIAIESGRHSYDLAYSLPDR